MWAIRVLRAGADFWRSLPGRFQLFAGAGVAALVLSSLSGNAPVRVDGLPPVERPITVTEVSTSEFERLLRSRPDGGDTNLEQCRRAGLRRLGLVSTAESDGVGEAIVSRITGQPMSAAFYRAGSDTVFTTDREHPAVRHEYVHAIDDQLGPRMQLAARGTTDRQAALRAAIEGTAVARLRTSPAAVPFGKDLDVNAWALAYGLGAGYVREHAQGNWEKAMALAPKTTYEILFGYPPPRRSSLPLPPDQDALCQDEVGVLGVITALQASGIGGEDATRIARAWVGDRLRVYRENDAVRSSWTVEFADSLAAAEWRRGPQLRLAMTKSDVRLTTRIADESDDAASTHPGPRLEDRLR